MKKVLLAAAAVLALSGAAHAQMPTDDNAVCAAYLPEAMNDFTQQVLQQYPQIQGGNVQAHTMNPHFNQGNPHETFKQHIMYNGQDLFGQPVEVLGCVVSVSLTGNLPAGMVHSVMLGYNVQHLPVIDKVLVQSYVMWSN